MLCGCAVFQDAASSSASFQEPAEPVAATVSAVYAVPEGGLTMEETVRAYFEQQYLSYTTFTDIDLGAILDLRMPSVRNSVIWTKMLNQRRRLIQQRGLCYVETQAFPYSVRFLSPEELEDDRIAFWNAQELTKQGEQLIHFVFEGLPEKAYPPIMAMNTQHTMRLRQEDGVWKIMFHYFPGAVRKFMLETALREYTDEEMNAMLDEEFGSVNLAGVSAPPDAPENTARYDAKAAAEYAVRYTQTPNPEYYNIGDWMGDCANFTSQCVRAGFPDGGMTEQWYAGEGGGSPAWENVENFWQYLAQGVGLISQEIGGVDDVVLGDVIQTAAYGAIAIEQEDVEIRFNHSLIFVDADKLLLAQHSPGCFVYYSDLVNVRTRIIRPLYVVE